MNYSTLKAKASGAWSSLKRRVGIRSALGIGQSLKRSPLRRSKPISPGRCELKRGNLQRSGKLAKRSASKIADDKVWAEVKAAKLLTVDRCAWPGCANRPTEAHHHLSRARGGKSTWDNCVLLCAEHHHFTHHISPAIAEFHGLLASGHTHITPAQQHAPSQRGGEQ